MTGAARTERDARGRFLRGHRALKQRGMRTPGPADFRDALQADWEGDGAACIARLREEDPERYLLIMMAILPRRRERRRR